MTGTILQLVAKGMEDVYLMNDPQITLFKIVYRRPTNFSMYEKKISSKSSGNFSTKMEVIIPRDADLLHKLWLTVDLPEIYLAKKKSTFKNLALILSSAAVTWNFSPEDPNSTATLVTYNGATISDGTAITITLPTSQTLTTSDMSIGDTTINITNGYIIVNGTDKMKISSGTLNLSSHITGSNQNVTQQIIQVIGGTINLLDSSVTGTTLLNLSGTVTIASSTIISSLNLFSEFTNSIINAINNRLQILLDQYNFYNNIDIVTGNSDFIIEKSVLVFDRLQPTNTVTASTMIEQIKQQMRTGRNLFMYLFGTYMIVYNSDYNLLNSTILPTYDPFANRQSFYLPINSNNYSIVTSGSPPNLTYKTIQLFSNEFKNVLIKYGILLSAIQNYSYDTIVYNCSGDSSLNVDNFSSQPLFGNILTRPVGIDQSTFVPFSIYNSDDIRLLFYISFIYNITRLKVVASQNQMVAFNPQYSTIVRSTNIGVSADNLTNLDPSVSSISKIILFYHSLDPDITNYVVYQYNVGEQTSVYFDNNIGKNYSIFSKYINIIPIDNSNFQITDSYKIYKSYIQTSVNTDIANNNVKSDQQINLIANILKYNIDANIRFNFGQTLNNILVLSNASRTISNHYNLTFYKTFLSSSGTFSQAAGVSFTPIIGNSDLLLGDYFQSIINTNIPVALPTGINVTQFFNTYIQSQIKIFLTSCQATLRATNYDSYLSDFTLWQRLLISGTTPLLSAYSLGIGTSNIPVPDTTVFGNIALMNYVPLLVAKDIPKLVYDTFVLYAQQIMVDITADTLPSTTNYSTFLTTIDMRDSDDGTNVTSTSETLETKKEIYSRLINAIFVTTYQGSSSIVVDNASYFGELQNTQGTSSFSLIACSLRPESFFQQYSTQNVNGSGQLVDNSSSPSTLKYLPLEWLTQTYYKIFSNKINTFINTLSISSSNKTLAQSLLIGMLGNVINSFISRSNLPPYSDYINNQYLLLGLTSETNTIIQKYKQASSVQSVSQSSYSDLMSSVWYQVQKGFIQLYNKLFNDTLISANYFTNNLGSAMGEIFNYIQTTLTANGLNTYYSNSTPYTYYLPQSLIDSFAVVNSNKFSTLSGQQLNDAVLNNVGELNPGVDTKNGSIGFDFYRINGMNSCSANINTFIQDYFSLYSFIFNYYNTHKSITLIKNDNDNIFYTQSQTLVGTRSRNTYQYEQSSIINKYFQDHINIKYVTPANSLIKSDLNNLNVLVATYWNPDGTDSNGEYQRNPAGVYGVMDAIYNRNLTGNLINIINNMATIPNNLTVNSGVDFTQNPFTSFCLHNWFLMLGGSDGFTQLTYQNLQNSVDLLNSIVYNGQTRLISSQFISNSKNLVKSYGDINGNIFPSLEYVVWFLFDVIIANPELNKFVNFGLVPQLIEKQTSGVFNTTIFLNSSSTLSESGGALDTLQQLITSFIDPLTSSTFSNLSSMSTIEQSLTIPINGTNQYINSNNSNNTDILFYQKSLDGNPITGTTLESKILNSLKQSIPRFAWVRELGHRIAKKINIFLGDELIESYTPELMHLHHQMNKDIEHERGYNIMIGNVEEMYTISDAQRSIKTLYIPLHFWFCKNAGNAFPLISSMFTKLRIVLEINDISELLYTDTGSVFKKQPKLKCYLLGTFIYLEDAERARMANSKLEYLIERYNYDGIQTFSRSNIYINGIDLRNIDSNDPNLINNPPKLKIDIKIIDPIKYFIWYIKFVDKTTQQPIDVINWCDFGYNVRDSNGTLEDIKNTIDSITLNMNEVQREGPHDELFYTNLVPYSRYTSPLNNGEYIYSFALFPLLLQPTGSANYSEIPSSELVIVLKNQILNLLQNNPNLTMYSELWGQSQNILRFASGMGGLLFMKP